MVWPGTVEAMDEQVHPQDVRIEYRSGEDLEPFRAAWEALLPPFQEGE